jgi:hypothetical protein
MKVSHGIDWRIDRIHIRMVRNLSWIHNKETRHEQTFVGEKDFGMRKRGLWEKLNNLPDGPDSTR